MQYHIVWVTNKGFSNLENIKAYTIRKEDNLEEEPFGFLLLFEENSKILMLGANGEKLENLDIVLPVASWLKLYHS